MDRYEDFIKKIYDKFSDKVTKTELYKILDVMDNYDKDSPNSTGKYLKVCRVKLYGEKNIDGVKSKIDYDRKLFGGVNIWIADNFKGKSSILKIIKYALTGDNDLKPDVSHWIRKIYVEFKVGEINYTIFIDSLPGSRKKGKLYKITIDDLLNNNEVDDLLVVFSFNSDTTFLEKIQDFFFNQLSFYPLKWTQKDGRKDSINLNESKTSWKTYFKSIFLESKDYSTLFLHNSFGNQEQKILEMLMGLKFTYPINRLMVNMDFLKNKMAQDSLSINLHIDKQTDNLKKLNQKLFDVESKIKKNDVEINKHFNNNELFEKRNMLSNKIMYESKKLNLLTEQKNSLKNEIDKTHKFINNLCEYIEFGNYFNGLEITVCPHCDNKIEEEQKCVEREKHVCMVCNKQMSKRNDISLYEEKLMEQKKQLNALEESFNIIIENIGSSGRVVDGLISEFNKVESEIETRNNNEHYNKLKEDSYALREQKGSLKKEIESLESNLKDKNNSIDEVKTEIKVEILEDAILMLENERYEQSKGIYNRFNELMLNQLSEFGLTSISEVTLDKTLTIRFVQNCETVTFAGLSEGEKLRVKIAFFLSLIQLDIEYKVGRHPRFLIIDSPGKEEVVKKDLSGLAKIFKDIDKKYSGDIQILIGTALHEFENASNDIRKIENKGQDETIF